MELLSRELVSHEFRDQLVQDMSRATVCRFLVAYVSESGVDSIGRHLLARGLRNSRSFGVASLSCSCGYKPLLRLQADLPEVRLKYFMEPIVKEPDEPSEISLFHSKLIYLHLERESKSIVYIGSHNWSQRALGPQGPRNVEASIRFELPFAPEHLDGSDDSVASHVNLHLIDAWNMPLCMPATQSNEPAFLQWMNKGCRRASGLSLEDNTILLAVRRNPEQPIDWQSLSGRGIYLQALNETDGQIVWNSNNRLLLLVWESDADLSAGRPPMILECLIPTTNAGPDSELGGQNQSQNPIVGFAAVVWDVDELAALRDGRRARRSPIRIWSGREVDVYDFDAPAPHVESSKIDGGVQPKYQFHLKVQRVVFPEDRDRPRDGKYVWPSRSFTVAYSRDDLRLEESPGYRVDPQREKEMLDCLRNVLLVDPDQAKVRPYSDADTAKMAKVDKRVSDHPLHDTFLRLELQDEALRDKYYEQSESGSLVAELDQIAGRQRSRKRDTEHIDRLQRVVTKPLDDLAEIWEATAKQRQGEKKLERGRGESDIKE